IVWLADHGYNRLDAVEVPGDFAVRGGIVDLYLPGEQRLPNGDEVIGLPVRVDFFGDQIERVTTFDLDSLGSGQKLNAIELVDLKGDLSQSGDGCSFLKYLPKNAAVVLVDPLEIAEQGKSYLDRLPDQRGVYPLKAVLDNANPYRIVQVSPFEQKDTPVTLVGHLDPRRVKVPVRSLTRFETHAKAALSELKDLAETNDVAVFCSNESERKRFVELLDLEHKGLSKKVDTPLGYLHRGFIFGDELRDTGEMPLALLGHHELFNRFEKRRRVKKVAAGKAVDSFLDLNIGDYVVHVAHGIAKFTGMSTMDRDGKTEEYLTLRFADEGQLYVPASRISLIQKYVGGPGGHPNLSKLGSGSWEKQKDKVAEAVMDMASDLLEVQAARAAEAGTAFPPDTEWQREFEAEFPYDETDDQLTAADEIKQDMTLPRPMDRLLCGDVGYGKTELAMRAAFKAVEFGRQVAVLVPTTVLAEQHERSFRERFADYPFAIESVSRYKTKGEATDVLKRLKKGEVDIIIGTHRLLSKDVEFADLGLVVVDEEQRFGVTHKERLKQMRAMVDVLTMSATPIPRTLHMSMVGVRDISSLTTAPRDRRSIVTEVLAYDEERIKLAIHRELQRNGQVFFLHNRVNDIETITAKVKALVPDARVIHGHGQMADGELEKVMTQFIR
ncbi:MAG: DEAD/DEAH box helicase, partial [Planctomycetota bacterium]